MMQKLKQKDEVSKYKAKKMLYIKEDKTIHVFTNIPFGLLGCDYPLKEVIKRIDESYKCKLAGKQAQELGHGLVLVPSEKCKQSDLLFVETKEDD